MAQQTSTDRTPRGMAGGEELAVPVVPEVTVRLGGALLALAVATAHVTDQGGVTAFTSPDWLGWAYRLIEVGGVLTALALIWLAWHGSAGPPACYSVQLRSLATSRHEPWACRATRVTWATGLTGSAPWPSSSRPGSSHSPSGCCGHTYVAGRPRLNPRPTIPS
jgi:hypothetical protein